MPFFCLQCSKQFALSRKDKRFCSRTCVYKFYNDRRPRKTSKSYMQADKMRMSHIPQQETEIIYGTLMGDGSLIQQTNGFHRISFTHGIRQKEYLDMKRNLLPSIILQDHLNVSKNSFGTDQYHLGSISHKDLTNIYGLFYRFGHKAITRRILNKLTETSLLFWYLDDGSIIKASGDTIILCTDSFSLSENKAIKQWFWQRWGLKSFIMPVRGGFSDKVYYRIRFRKEDSILFIKIVKSSPVFNLVPVNMHYKFPKYI